MWEGRHLEEHLAALRPDGVEVEVERGEGGMADEGFSHCVPGDLTAHTAHIKAKQYIGASGSLFPMPVSERSMLVRVMLFFKLSAIEATP